MSEKRFPVMRPDTRAEIAEEEQLSCPRSVPWGLVLQHEQQALDNHEQSVATLASRGGLDIVELWWVLTGRRLTGRLIERARLDVEQAVREVRQAALDWDDSKGRLAVAERVCEAVLKAITPTDGKPDISDLVKTLCDSGTSTEDGDAVNAALLEYIAEGR